MLIVWWPVLISDLVTIGVRATPRFTPLFRLGITGSAAHSDKQGSRSPD